MIKAKRESLILQAGELIISEATWDSTFRMSSLEEEGKKDPGEDKTFEFFRVNLYPVLACCAEGIVPSAHSAFYDLKRDTLDDWYILVWKLNPDMFIDEYREASSEVVTFRDKSQITIYDNRHLPSFNLRIFELEQAGADHPFDDPSSQTFQTAFYPKMAACVNGSKIPDVDTALTWPRSELNKWFEAARRLNPDWFAALDQASEEAKKETVKKKRRSRPADKKAVTVLPGK